jgi:uncharacterized protein YndB with AHSA1/START domain
MNVNVKFEIPTAIGNVFDSIISAKQMCNYFISKADHDMIEGKTIKWQFSNFKTKIYVIVSVLKVTHNTLIQFSWAVTGKTTTVEITLEKKNNNCTIIKINEGEWSNNKLGFERTLQQTIGWTDFCNCLKAYLIFNINLRTGKKLNNNGDINDSIKFKKH